MTAEVLIDTSAWIQLFRDGQGSGALEAARLLRLGTAAISGPVAAELVRGARSTKELGALERLFAAVRWLDTSPRIYRDAGHLGYSLARKGASVGTVDLILAQVALTHSVPILTLDRHFALIAEHTPLKLVLTPATHP